MMLYTCINRYIIRGWSVEWHSSVRADLVKPAEPQWPPDAAASLHIPQKKRQKHSAEKLRPGLTLIRRSRVKQDVWFWSKPTDRVQLRLFIRFSSEERSRGQQGESSLPHH